MPNSISPVTAAIHRPWCLDHPDTDIQCTTTTTVRGTNMTLTLVQNPDGSDPYISFDQYADLINTGHVRLADAGALSAALDELRVKAANR